MSASWDRCIHVYNDLLQHDLPLLRRIVSAHPTDITALAVSRPLSLIASGGEDGTVALWDFQSCRSCGQVSWSDAPVQAVLFLEDTPIMATGDAKGVICLWWVQTGPRR